MPEIDTMCITGGRAYICVFVPERLSLMMEKLVLFLVLGVLLTGWPLLQAQQLTTDPTDPPNGLALVSTRSAVTAITGEPKVVLSCTLVGSATEINAFCADSQSNLQWKVNGTQLGQTQYGSEFLVEGNCTHTYLTFLQVYPELEGKYTCELSNNATVKANTVVTIRPGCNPDIFRGNAAVGDSVITPCGGIHPAFNSLGSIRWICVDHLRWSGDLTNCTFVPLYNKSILLFLYRVTVAPNSTVGSLLNEPHPLEQDFLNNVLPMLLGPMVNANGRIADIRASERWLTELLVLFAIEPQAPVNHNGVLQAAQEPVILAGQNASPVYAGNPKFVPSDTCTCPKLWSDFNGALLERVPVTVSFCKAPNYVRSPCRCLNGCQCTGVFFDPGTEAVNCSLDTDGDSIPDAVDSCQGCCLGEVNSGYTWMDTPIELNSLISCASIHSSFNAKSYATRRCSSDPAGVWGAVGLSGCAFRPGSNMTIVVLEADVDLVYLQGTQQTVHEAVKNETDSQFSRYGLLGTDIRVSSESHVVAIMEFPRDVREDVVLVYHTPRKRETVTEPSQREKRVAVLSLFSNTPVVYGHRPSETCPCSPIEPSLSGRLFDTCIGPPGKLCRCTGPQCNCVDPYAEASSSTNTTLICGVDSDGDGIPDVDDLCPLMYSPNGDCAVSIFGEDEVTCESAADPVWGILWSQTGAGGTDIQRCPGGITDATGLATRYCRRDGEWAKPNVRACESYQFAAVRSTSKEVEASFSHTPAFMARSSMFRIDVSSGSVSVLDDSARTLMSSTEPQAKPLLPTDLDATLLYLEVVSSLSEVTTLFAVEDFDEDIVFTIIDNILDGNNQEQWELLNGGGYDYDANVMLELVERISKAYSFNLDTHQGATSEMDDNGIENMYQSWDGLHIFVSAELISPTTPPRGVPRAGNAMGGRPPQTFDRPDMVPTIMIPNGLLEERAEAMGESRVSVVTVVISTLADFLPEQAEDDVDRNSALASVVIASQVSLVGGESTSLQNQPVQIQFPIPDSVRAGGVTTCVFWNFTAPTTNGTSSSMGGWSRSGLDMDDITSDSSEVTCLSSHLTSFAILVDASGVTGVISAEEALAFDIVTYIGCAVSLACLILTVLFYLFQGRELYKKAVNFVHLNLAIALLCGLITFVAGIETAAWSKIACGFVAALLHYFFLAAFSWMLCEGVSLYLLLVKVFGANKKKWLLMYTLLGWGTPLPIVAVSVGIRYDYYRIPSSYNTNSTLYNETRACWLPTEYGVIAAFIVPMLVMILINCVFGALALKSVFKFKKDQVKRSMDGMKEREIAIALMKALVILLPLLGVTWVIGLLAVNPYTTVFAWIFLFLNAFQGAFIFFFHVVRHDKVWPRLVKCFSRCRKGKAAVTEDSTSKRSNTVSSSVAFSRTNTAVSLLDPPRKTSVISNDFVSTADEDENNIEKTIPATVVEEKQLMNDNDTTL